MCADAVVAAFNRSNVLKNDVATISMNIEAVVLGMRGRQVADDKMCIVAAKLDSRRADGLSDVGLRKRLPRLQFDEERAASFIGIGSAFRFCVIPDKGPLPRFKFFRLA